MLSIGLNLDPCHQLWWQLPNSWKIACMAQNIATCTCNNLIRSNITFWAFGVGVGGLLAYTENLIINAIIIFYLYTLLISIHIVDKWNNLIKSLLCFTSIQYEEAKFFLKLGFFPLASRLVLQILNWHEIEKTRNGFIWSNYMYNEE